MRATIVVTAAPYVGVADGAGRFSFDGVVPGKYAVTWFEKGQPRHKEIDVRGPGTAVVLP